MPTYRVLMRVDAYVEYETQVDADDPKEASEIAYRDGPEVIWKELGTSEFDARHVVTLDDAGEEIDETRWGKG